MNYRHLHFWKVSPEEAREIQLRLRERINLKRSSKKIERIAGTDVGYFNNQAIGAVVVFEFPPLRVIEKKFSLFPVDFPYIPGLLTFREGPALLGAFEKIKNEPDLILFDGQGIAHPRRMGIATHLGLFLDKATIGCAKSRLIGEYSPPGEERGEYSLLKKKGETIGAVVRTKKKVKPVFISPGNRMDLITSIRMVLECSLKYKLPEPTRRAHLLAEKIKGEIAHGKNQKDCSGLFGRTGYLGNSFLA